MTEVSNETFDENIESVPVPAAPPSLGRVKFFNAQRGYGFIHDMIQNVDCFVHHSNLIVSHPSTYRILYQGEYLSFVPFVTPRGIEAQQVQGVLGGPLMCEGL
jgi:cold shock CspA family protein